MLPTTARVNKTDPLPRHYQVRQILVEMIAYGLWQPGDKIPAETDIAKSLGVSKMTVNKAILALTAEGVLYREVGRGTFIAEAPHRQRNGNYLPDRDAAEVEPRRGSASHLFEVITIAPPELVSDNEYMCALLLSMRCCASPLEVRLVLRHVRGADYLARYRESRADGWLLIAPLEEDVPGLRALAAAGAKAVVIGAAWKGVALPCVDSDNIGGATLAVEHLAELGHRDIALLYATPHSINTQDRIRGFQQAMQARGLPLRTDWILDVKSSTHIPEPVQQRLRAWLRSSDRPTALFAAGPFVARHVLDIAQEVGIRVPDELSIVAFDDPTAVAESSPVMTTIRQPLEAMGQEGITYLREMLRAPEAAAPRRLILPCRLLVRESTAPPPRQRRS